MREYLDLGSVVLNSMMINFFFFLGRDRMYGDVDDGTGKREEMVNRRTCSTALLRNGSGSRILDKKNLVYYYH